MGHVYQLIGLMFLEKSANYFAAKALLTIGITYGYLLTTKMELHIDAVPSTMFVNFKPLLCCLYILYGHTLYVNSDQDHWFSVVLAVPGSLMFPKTAVTSTEVSPFLTIPIFISSPTLLSATNVTSASIFITVLSL